MKVYLAGGGGMSIEYAEAWRNEASKYFDTINPFRANKLRTAYGTGSYQGEKHFTPNGAKATTILEQQVKSFMHIA